MITIYYYIFSSQLTHEVFGSTESDIEVIRNLSSMYSSSQLNVTNSHVTNDSVVDKLLFNSHQRE